MWENWHRCDVDSSWFSLIFGDFIHAWQCLNVTRSNEINTCIELLQAMCTVTVANRSKCGIVDLVYAWLASDTEAALWSSVPVSDSFPIFTHPYYIIFNTISITNEFSYLPLASQPTINQPHLSSKWFYPWFKKNTRKQLVLKPPVTCSSKDASSTNL